MGLTKHKHNTTRGLAILLAAAAVFSGASAAQRAKSRAKAPNAEELLETARTALTDYDSETLREALDKLDEASRLTPQQEQELETLRNRAVALSNMLSRVQNLIVLDSIDMPQDSVGTSFTLTKGAGVLTATAHTPNGARERFETVADSAGRLSIVRVPLLDDGTGLEAEALNLFADAPGVQTAFPYLTWDGSTLYFAALDVPGDNSLGGWDTYMTRRDETGQFMQPVNMGMPYNTPYNDFMLAMDGESGLGWLATDRNEPGADTVTVYIFKIADTRVNLEPDQTENLVSRAALLSVEETWPEGFNGMDEARKTMETIRENNAHKGATREFAISLGDGRILTSASQMPNYQARNLLDKYLAKRAAVEQLEQNLSNLRAQYASGKKSVKAQILQGEKQLKLLRAQLKAAQNAVVRAVAN